MRTIPKLQSFLLLLLWSAYVPHLAWAQNAVSSAVTEATSPVSAPVSVQEIRDFLWTYCDASPTHVCNASGGTLLQTDIWLEVDQLGLPVVRTMTRREQRFARLGFTLLGLGALTALSAPISGIAAGLRDVEMNLILGAGFALGGAGILSIVVPRQNAQPIDENHADFTVPIQSIRARNRHAVAEKYPAEIAQAQINLATDPNYTSPAVARSQAPPRNHLRHARAIVVPVATAGTLGIMALTGSVKMFFCPWKNGGERHVPIPLPDLTNKCSRIARYVLAAPYGAMAGVFISGTSQSKYTTLSNSATVAIFSVAIAGGFAGAVVANKLITRTEDNLLWGYLANAALTSIPPALLAIPLIRRSADSARNSNNVNLQLSILPTVAGAGGQFIGTLNL